MFARLGGKLASAISSATDAAKQAAAAAMQKAGALAKQGAVAVAKGMQRVLESNLASAAAIKGMALVPGVGSALSAGATVLKLGYDYALKGEKDYESADVYGAGRLQDAANVHCGGDVKKEKVRRRKERERMIAFGKASPDSNKQRAAERLERDMVGVERARLSKHVYDEYDPEKQPPPEPPIGFLRPTDEELAKLGVKPSDLAPQDSSFRAQIYKVDPQVGPIPPDYITAYRGTVGKEDWTQANIPQGLGRETEGYNSAMSLANKMAEAMETATVESGVESKVEFTGHSLGGGYASAAAVLTGEKATTQNSAGLHRNTTERFDQTKPLDREAAKKFVDAYRIDGAEKTEILTSVNKLPLVPDAVGEPRKLAAPKEGVSRLGLHGIDAVIDSIENQKIADQQTLHPR